jgi:hypothetical protein
MCAVAARKLDCVMAAVVENMTLTINETINRSVQEILGISSRFMNEASHEALRDFHQLYFSSDALSTQKHDVNADVDLLFEAIQSTISSGGSVDAIEENEENKTVRLGLAALQKQLESILQLDRGMREKLVPAIMSMQFEDATRQRLSHLTYMWNLVSEVASESTKLMQERVDEEMKKTLTSAQERELFFPIVLLEPPPAVVDSDETWLSSLL